MPFCQLLMSIPFILFSAPYRYEISPINLFVLLAAQPHHALVGVVEGRRLAVPSAKQDDVPAVVLAAFAELAS